MLEQLKRVRDFLEDDLLLRVTFFNMGTLILILPITAFVSGLVIEVNDGSFYVLLVLLCIFGLFLVFTAVFGGDALMKKAMVWGNPGDFWLAAGFITLAVPITLLIRHFRRKHDSSAL